MCCQATNRSAEKSSFLSHAVQSFVPRHLIRYIYTLLSRLGIQRLWYPGMLIKYNLKLVLPPIQPRLLTSR